MTPYYSENKVLKFPSSITLEKAIRDCLWKATADWREAKRRGWTYREMLDYRAAQRQKRLARKAKRAIQ